MFTLSFTTLRAQGGAAFSIGIPIASVVTVDVLRLTLAKAIRVNISRINIITSATIIS